MKKIFQSIFLATVLASTAIATETDNFGGLGISFYSGKNGVSVVGVMPNSPAYTIGLQTGDLILSANGIELTSVEPSQQVSYLRGKAGSSINLIVERAGKKLTLSTKRVELSLQKLNESDISAWYGKSEGLTAEEINHLANQKVAEGYQLLGTMQHGMPISHSAENLNANAVQQISIKEATESENLPSQPQDLNLDDKTLVNVKGARIQKTDNGNKKSFVPAYKMLR